MPDPAVLTKKSYNPWRDFFEENPDENLQPVQEIVVKAKQAEQERNDPLALDLFRRALKCLKEIIRAQLLSDSLSKAGWPATAGHFELTDSQLFRHYDFLSKNVQDLLINLHVKMALCHKRLKDYSEALFLFFRADLWCGATYGESNPKSHAIVEYLLQCEELLSQEEVALRPPQP